MKFTEPKTMYSGRLQGNVNTSHVQLNLKPCSKPNPSGNGEGVPERDFASGHHALDWKVIPQGVDPDWKRRVKINLRSKIFYDKKRMENKLSIEGIAK